MGDKLANLLHHTQKPVNFHTHQSRRSGQPADFNIVDVEKERKENVTVNLTRPDTI